MRSVIIPVFLMLVVAVTACTRGPGAEGSRSRAAPPVPAAREYLDSFLQTRGRDYSACIDTDNALPRNVKAVQQVGAEAQGVTMALIEACFGSNLAAERSGLATNLFRDVDGSVLTNQTQAEINRLFDEREQRIRLWLAQLQPRLTKQDPVSRTVLDQELQQVTRAFQPPR